MTERGAIIPDQAFLESEPRIDRDSTRREFLGSSAAALATFYGLPDLAVASMRKRVPHQPVESMMKKGLNTVAFTVESTGGQESTLGFIERGGAQAVVLWAPSWESVDPESWHRDDALWEQLKSNVQTVSGIAEVYIAVSCAYPAWAAEPGHAPKERGEKSPWAQYYRKILEICPNVRGIAPLNEPNIAFAHDRKLAALHAAEMIRTACLVMDDADYSGQVLAPATADTKDLSCVKFFDDTSRHLEGLKTRCELVAAHHNYADVKDGTTVRLAAILRLLEKRRGPLGAKIAISETGYEFDTHMTDQTGVFAYNKPLAKQEAAQLRKLIKNYEWCRRSGRVILWANYTLQDTALGGGGFMCGLKRIDGTPHPVLKAWLKL